MELLFKNIERHVSLSAGDKKLLEEIYHVKKVKRKQFLLEAGEVSKYTYFVTKGCIRTYYTDKEGEEHVIGFSIEDWWAGDLAGFSTGESSIFSIDALEDSEVLCADRNGLERMYREIPQMEKYFRIIFQNSLAAQFQRITNTNSFTAEERYVAFRKKYPQFDRRIPQKYLASYLGITPEFLSKLKKQLLKR
ncbi:MAG TPA: Crp/Fnr family transcriptional regulator [Bacteroidia bacterium]|jgi:CRP-like cAMP-binding protein|nr:Crp/Fnr family transcriptional regulator [Bacteroidia bacterium]